MAISSSLNESLFIALTDRALSDELVLSVNTANTVAAATTIVANATNTLAAAALPKTSAFQIVLSAAAESANAIVVTGTVKDLTGAAVGVAKQVLVRTLAVTDNKGDITVTTGTGIKVVNPATGENVAWITTTSGGAFAFSVADDAVETVLVQVTSDLALAATLKLTFA